jgi:hypothetical protein
MGLGHLDGALVQREKAEKIGARRRVEDDLQDDNNSEEWCSGRWTRTNPLIVQRGPV